MKLKFMEEGAAVTVIWPVTFSWPEDGGGFSSHTAKVQFLLLPADEAQALLMPNRETLLTALAEGAPSDPTLAFLRKVVVGWDTSSVDGLGEVFSPKALERLLRWTSVRQDLVDAYTRAAQGRRAKN